MKKKVSVIVPVYNVESFIAECIGSILVQTHSIFELIIVNDGSKDNSISNIIELVKNDSRVIIVDKTNGGLSSARNHGLNYVSGDYITFVDSDDYLHPDFLKEMLNSIGNADICSCSYNETTENGHYLRTVHNNLTHQFDGDAFSLAIESIDLIPNAWGKLYKKDIFSEISYPENLLFEDYAIAYKIFYQRKATFIDRGLYNYRIRNGSIMRTLNENIITHKFKILDELYSFLKEKKIYSLYYKSFINAYIYHGVFVTSCIVINQSDYHDVKKLERFIKKNVDNKIYSIPNLIKSGSIKLDIKVFLLLLKVSPRIAFFLKKMKSKTK